MSYWLVLPLSALYSIPLSSLFVWISIFCFSFFFFFFLHKEFQNETNNRSIFSSGLTICVYRFTIYILFLCKWMRRTTGRRKKNGRVEWTKTSPYKYNSYKPIRVEDEEASLWYGFMILHVIAIIWRKTLRGLFIQVLLKRSGTVETPGRNARSPRSQALLHPLIWWCFCFCFSGMDPNWRHIIPPLQENVISEGHCTDDCTKKTFPPQGISIFAVIMQTHNIGKEVKLRQVRTF